MDKTFGYQTGNAPDQRLNRLQNSYEPEGEVVDEKCWVGYTQKGMKKKGNRVVPNCVKTEQYDSRNPKDRGNPDNSLRRAVRGMGEDPSNVLPSKLVKSVKEEMTRINENGQTYAVILTWRGKTYTFQMFVPTMRRPSKQEVEAQVRKVYPDARVLQFMPKQYDPADPTIMIPESYVKEQSVPVTAYNKGDRFTGRAGAMTPDEIRRANEGSANRIRKTIPLANSHEPEGEMVEQIRAGKPGDGWIGPTVGGYGIPNPIRVLGQDPADIQIRRLRQKVKDVNAAGGGYLGNIKQTGQKTYNSQTSDAYNKLFGTPKKELRSDSYKPEGEIVSESNPYKVGDTIPDSATKPKKPSKFGVDKTGLKGPEKPLGEAAAWTKKSGKNPEGGLNEKGRKSYERENPGSDLKAPSKKVGNKRRASFCARMKGMKKKLTSAKTANDPDSRINKSLRAWNC